MDTPARIEEWLRRYSASYAVNVDAAAAIEELQLARHRRQLLRRHRRRRLDAQVDLGVETRSQRVSLVSFF